MSRTHIGLMVGTVVVFFVGFAVVAVAEAPTTLCSTVNTYDEEGAPSTRLLFDLEGCQDDCRNRYGYSLYWRGGHRGGVNPGYWLYARCIQACNRAHWDAFDREMDDLSKE